MTGKISPSDASYYFQANSTSVQSDFDSAIVYGNFFHALKNSTVLYSNLRVKPVLVTEKVSLQKKRPAGKS